jgi:hypothetical protein
VQLEVKKEVMRMETQGVQEEITALFMEEAEMV